MTNTVQLSPNLVEGAAISRRSSATTADLTGVDPFMQIIQSMVAAMGENQEEESASMPTKDNKELLDLMALFGMPADALQNLPFADLAKMMESVNNGTINIAQVLNVTEKAVGEQASQVATKAADFVQIDTASFADEAAAMQQLVKPVATQKPQESSLVNAMLLGSASIQTEEEITTEQAQGVPQNYLNKTELLQAQRSMRSIVSSVKETLQKNSGEVDEKIDVDKLQAQVNSQKTEFDGQVKKLQVQQPTVVEQMETEIKSQVLKGAKEFTMKLKPQELGEITVKLTESAGKVSLSILTASSQTAKLINSDLSVLREALAPMQVEVREAVQKAGGAESGAFSMEMSERQFSGGQRSFEDGQNKPQYYRVENSADISEAEKAEEIAINALNVVL